MNNLHPSTRWIFRLRGYRIYLGFIIFFIFLYIGMASSSGFKGIGIPYGILFLILLMIISGEIYARMAYNRYLYEINNDEFKVERGIIWKKYSSVPFERVQNVDIKRGIVARMFGFSTVDIETAGSSSGPYKQGGFYVQYGNRKNKHYEAEGHIPGVSIEEAERIREFILSKITKKGRKQGL